MPFPQVRSVAYDPLSKVARNTPKVLEIQHLTRTRTTAVRWTGPRRTYTHVWTGDRLRTKSGTNLATLTASFVPHLCHHTQMIDRFWCKKIFWRDVSWRMVNQVKIVIILEIWLDLIIMIKIVSHTLISTSCSRVLYTKNRIKAYSGSYSTTSFIQKHAKIVVYRCYK